MKTSTIGLVSIAIGIGSAFGAQWLVESYLQWGPHDFLWYAGFGALMTASSYDQGIKQAAAEKITDSDKL